jgi:hypothetical protein
LFFIVFPLGIIDILVTINWLRNVSKPTNDDFDFWGLVFSNLGFGSLLYGFSKAGHKGWGVSWSLDSLQWALSFFFLFVAKQLSAKQPMLQI